MSGIYHSFQFLTSQLACCFEPDKNKKWGASRPSCFYSLYIRNGGALITVSPFRFIPIGSVKTEKQDNLLCTILLKGRFSESTKYPQNIFGETQREIIYIKLHHMFQILTKKHMLHE